MFYLITNVHMANINSFNMSIDKLVFLNNVRSQFDSTNPEVIQYDTHFDTLDEWCSLVGLGVIAMIQDKYNIKIPLRELISVNTVEDLYNIVAKVNE